MDKMLVTTFNSDAQAYLGLDALENLHNEGEISLYATAVISKDLDGEIIVKQEADKGPIGTSVGLLTGALIGGLAGGVVGATAVSVAATAGYGASVGALGGLTYDAIEHSINADFLEEISKLLLPGKTAIIAEIGESFEVPVNTAMTLLGGVVYRIPRDDVIENQLIDESIELNIALEELEEKLKTANSKNREALKRTKTSIKTKLKSIVEKANEKIDEINKETEAKVNKLNSQMKSAKAEQKSKIERRVTRLKAAHKARTQKLKKAGTLAKEALKKQKVTA